MAPRVAGGLAWTALRKHRLRSLIPTEDPFQLGGDVVVGAGGGTAWMHRSATPADRPPVELLLAEMDRAYRGAAA
jgi:hypothetical protein